jgi:hypothetical protein
MPDIAGVQHSATAVSASRHDARAQTRGGRPADIAGLDVQAAVLGCVGALAGAASTAETGPLEISDRYPHLAMFNQQGECGIGAVVPWADRLWVVTYAPQPSGGGDDKLYEITPELQSRAHLESVGGTPAGRVHRAGAVGAGQQRRALGVPRRDLRGAGRCAVVALSRQSRGSGAWRAAAQAQSVRFNPRPRGGGATQAQSVQSGLSQHHVTIKARTHTRRA